LRLEAIIIEGVDSYRVHVQDKGWSEWAKAADGKGSLTGKITYSVMAVAKSEASKYLDAYFAQQVDGKTNQKVYDNGANGLTLSNPVADGETSVVSVVTNGKIGPKVDENEVKEFAKGKKAGEIKAHVESVSGVESAEVSFSPFWVTKAPGDISKIKVEFKLND
jgi:copper chaperone CopZ